MNVAVAGLWHLGCVTAACCASGEHNVVAFDDDQETVSNLKQGRLPVEEPGLSDLVKTGLETGWLAFTSDPGVAVSSADVLWVCYDTPVDENDVADIEFVLSRVGTLLANLPSTALVLISSQLPVGTVATLEHRYPEFEFACSPENLRLGKALQVFRNPDRVIVGVRHDRSRERICALFSPFTDRLEWMSVESAEMTKHALNSFLATSVAFINEVATLCEKTGADAQQVERGLKTDIRIGPGAYLHPGAAFAGGTLARDVSFLRSIGLAHNVPIRLFEGVLESNNLHKLWIRRRLREAIPDLKQSRIGVLGLTYKPGTDTLRRSTSVEICQWLAAEGATVNAFDPAVHELPPNLREAIHLKKHPADAIQDADAVLVATPWPEFRSLPLGDFAGMRRKLIVDPGRHLEKLASEVQGLEFIAIGVGH